jgi:drug/metabolite transporter (DMT)-like permease
LGIALRVVATLALAIMFALVKLAGERGVNLIETLFFRQIAAIPLMVGIAAVSAQGLGMLATQRPWAQGRRMVLGLLAMGLNFTAAMLLPLPESTAIGYSVPIFATLLAILFLGETVGRHRWAAIGIGFVGVIIITHIWGGAHGNVIGIMAGISGAILTALATVFWFSLLSMLPLGAAMLWYAQPHDAQGWMLLAAIGVTGAIAQISLTASLRAAPVSIVMPIDYVGLIWASLLSWYVFDALPAITTWIGAPIIIASALYILWREHHSKKHAIS